MGLKVPLLNLKAQIKPLRKAILKGWTAALDNASFVGGPQLKAFEAEAARFLGAKHAIGCNSGTDALVMLLRAVGVGPGDEVIVPAFSFFATAEAVSLCGATPAFADIREEDFLIDPASVERLISPKTKAILPVHLYGLPVDLGPLKKFGLPMVEDSCQAFGARLGAQRCLGAYSFYPTKNLSGAGDGGLMATDDDKVAAECRLLRDHGSPKRYTHERIGYNSRLDELQAIALRVKLPKLKGWVAKRRKVAQAYLKGLKGLPLTLPPQSKDSVWHQFTVRVGQGKREALRAHLEAKGIGSAIFYPSPMHTQAPYAALKASCPVAEKVCHEVLSLPIYAELSAPQAKAVVDAVRTFFDA